MFLHRANCIFKYTNANSCFRSDEPHEGSVDVYYRWNLIKETYCSKDNKSSLKKGHSVITSSSLSYKITNLYYRNWRLYQQNWMSHAAIKLFIITYDVTSMYTNMKFNDPFSSVREACMLINSNQTFLISHQMR